MKILIADFLFVDAHKEMNKDFIYAISKFSQTDVISLNGYYDDQKEEFNTYNINIIDIEVVRKTGPIGARCFSLNLMRLTGKIARNKYDAVLCLGFETTLFGLGYSSFNRIPLFIFHHKNIDELTNKLKRIAFSCYKNRVFHVVFEEFFRDRLVRGIGISADKVFVIPHPVKPTRIVPTDKKYDCIGLCNSNEEGFILEAIDRDGDFQKYGLHILLRSKSLEKKEGAVEVIKGFLSKDVYDELMAAGKTVFVPLPDTYIYRLSGSIYDALARGKLVYTTSTYYAQEYEKRYPGTCKYIESVTQLIKMLHEQEDIYSNSSFQMFIEEHSIDIVCHDIEVMIKTVLNSLRE